MEHGNWMWIIVFLAAIMAARMVPRLLRKRTQRSYGTNFAKENPQVTQITTTKPESKDMMVLGGINRGVKTFSDIKRQTQLEYDELNEILEDLENRGLMRVEKKKGLLGIKVELYATEKGFKEYDA